MAARTSDEFFQAQFEPHRRAITLHCYRMLGSLQDAEELVQEILLKGWQRRAEVRAAQAMRAWLYQIATNACLDHLVKARRRRSLPHLAGTAPATSARLSGPIEEGLWVEPAPDTLFDAEDESGRPPDERVSRRERVGLAFVIALQALPPKQRAALLLVDVIGWTPKEVATLLETTVVSVHSLLQRARARLAARPGSTAPPEPSSADAAVVRRFISAWERRDIDALTALLAHDAVLSMPPQREWYAGPAAIGEFFEVVWAAQPGQRRIVLVGANGFPALAVYRRAVSEQEYRASGIMLLEVRKRRISKMIRFAFPKLFPLFGLPTQLAGDSDRRRSS